MRDKPFKAREKITQRMTHDGLMEQNRATGEERNISQKERDISFRQVSPRTDAAERTGQQALAAPAQQQSVPKDRRAGQSRSAENAGQPLNPQATGEKPEMVAPSGRVDHSEENRPPKTPASGKIPAINVQQHGTKYQSKFLNDAAKPENVELSGLQFIKDETPPGRQMGTSSGAEPETLPGKATDGALSKLWQRTGKYDVKHAKKTANGRVRLLRFESKIKPQGANPLAALAKGAAGGAILAAYSQAWQTEQENTGVEAGRRAGRAAETLSSKSSRLLSRFLQKRRIKRQYAKAARAAQNGTAAAKETVSAVGRIGRLVRSLVGPHRKVLIIIVVILFALFFISSLVTSCSTMMTSGFNSILSTSFTAEDTDINQAEAYYSQLELSLKQQIDNSEQSHPGYDEYDYRVGAIGHDPCELISYLTSMYGQFTFDQVKSVLQELFNEQYQLSFVPQTETQYHTVTTTDPTTGETTTTQQEYTYNILNVNLSADSFSGVAAPLLNQAGVTEMYNAYIQSRGNRQYFASPFSFDWNPYVVNINSDEVARIDVPDGTQVLSMLNGTVTQASGGTVVIDDGEGLNAVYSGCGSLSVHVGQTVKISDGIAASGSGFSIAVSDNGTALNPILFIVDADIGSNEAAGSMPLSGSVGSDRQLVEQLAGQYWMQDYINLILAVMQQESGGQGGDPMQAAEGPYNTQYPHKPNGITDPSYSIQCGIQELKADLQLAGCTSPTDMAAIDLALQGYNFGSGFITWAQQRGGYSTANAQAFSQMEAADLGWSSYGDPDYVPHVLRYYKTP